MTSLVFLSATSLLVLLESFAGVPHWQVETLGGGGVMIQAQTSWIFSGVLHP